MDASSPETTPRRYALIRAGVAGVALGIVALAGASLVLFDTGGLLTGAAGVVGTLLVSLLVGIWAGAPAAESDEPPQRERWAGAGIATALAGVFASFWELFGGATSGAPGRMLALLLLIAFPVYALGMLLPVILACAERRGEEGEAPGDGWGALGGMTVGLVAGAVGGLLLAGLALVPWLEPGPGLLVASVLLLVPLLLPEPERATHTERVLAEETTPFGTLRVTEVAYPGERQPERRLYLNDEQESGELVRSGAPALAYIAAAESWLSGVTPVGASYLFLGGGAYTLPRRIAERDPRARVTVVELDPEVTRLAYRFFGLRRDHGVTSVHGDARAFLERADEQRFDRIYVDVYGGTEALPYSLVTEEAFAAMHRRLAPGGVLALNLIGNATGPETLRLWSVVRTAAEVFPGVVLYHHLGTDYPDRQNFLLAGSTRAETPFPPRAGIFDRWVREAWPEVAGSMVFRDLFPAAPAAPAELRKVQSEK